MRQCYPSEAQFVWVGNSFGGRPQKFSFKLAGACARRFLA